MDGNFTSRPADRYASRVGSAPALVKRLDPVVYSDWSSAAPITRAQHNKFKRDGFLVLKGLFDPAEIDAVGSELARLRADASSLAPETVIREPGSDDIRSIFAIHTQNALLGRLAADERLVAIAKHILGDDVYIHQSRLNYKPGFTGKEFYWHSDFETWHVEDGMAAMRAISASILLSENHAFNGPLMLFPGSHRKFISCVGATPDDHYRTSLKKQEYGVPDRESLADLFAAHGIVAPTGPAGTVILFDCNMMHGSNSNITPLARSNAFLVYNAVSNALEEPFGALKPRPEFIAARQGFQALKAVSGDLRQPPGESNPTILA